MTTPPADIAAMRTLVDEVKKLQRHHDDGWFFYAAVLFEALPAAREALERVERQQANHVDTNDYIAEQAARLARLEEALRRVRAIVSPAIVGQHECDVIDAALEGRPHDADTVKWQRVHGPVIQGDAAVTSEVSAQAARDVAHWRTRAEHAEARLAKLEGRDE